MKRALATWFAALLLAAAACAQTAAQREFQPSQLRGFPRGTLAIERSGGRDTFRIWFADNDQRAQQGLMWIRQLPADHGMVFPLEPQREMHMWMKNTYLPLDMLFYDQAGRITLIHERAAPLTEDIISSGGKVAGVLEILGGESRRRNIKVGDRIVITSRGN